MDSPLLWTVIGAAVVVAGIGILVKWKQRPPPEEEKLHFQCPGCGRRLGYYPRQAGGNGACPRCRKQFTFPRL